MRKILYIAAGIMLMLTSCQKEMLFEDDSRRLAGDGIALYLSIPERTEVHTYSTSTPEEELIDNRSVYVLIFDGNDASSKLLDFGVAAEIQNSGAKSYHINLQEQPDARQAYITVNAKEILDDKSSGWIKNTTTLGEISATLQTAVLPSVNGIITASPSSHPMTGGSPLSGLSKGSSIGSSSQPVALTPATVKITVENRVPAKTNYTFSLEGANLGNVPEKGFIMPGQDISSVTLRNYGKDGDVASMIAGVTTSEGVQTTHSLFTYESLADNASFVIIKADYKGCEGYYKLAFYTDASKKNLRPLLRGFQYKMVIKQVLTAGYRTVGEALSSKPSNGIVYDINVDDGDSYDIITNGVQYLGVSNSEYIAYNSNYVNEFEMTYNDGITNSERTPFTTLTPFTATVLTYTADPSWSEGLVTASAGITLVEAVGGVLTKVSSIALPQPDIEGGAVRKEIRIFMSDEFRSGTIDIHIGNLHKTIKVKRELSFTIMGDTVSLGSGISFVSARTLRDPMSNTGGYGDPNTYSLAYGKTASPFVTGDGDQGIDPAQELFLQVHNRFQWQKNDYCYGELYLHRSTYEGRTKLSFSVEMRGTEPFGDYSYGPRYYISQAFWKNNQKGERLVQSTQTDRNGILKDYEIPLGSSGRWQARVLVGGDFIRIAEWDNSITIKDNHFEGDPESRPVSEADEKQIIFGKGNTIRFRIGLKSTNEGNPNRYGLVQLLLLDKRVTNKPSDNLKASILIFVRQGEAPDNLLTPGKSYNKYTGSGVSTETFVAPDVKFSAYPLIDPTNGAGGADISDHTLITDAVRPVFAPYPSYGEYMFQWSGDRMLHYANSSGSITGWDSSYASEEFKELCPDGYITPPSAIDGNPVYNGLRCGMVSSSYGRCNSASGTCLDGYLDRYMQIDEAEGGITCYTSNKTIPVIGTSNEYSYYNPETMASIFMPRLLYRWFYDGAAIYDRRFGTGHFWTRDVDPANKANAAAMMLGIHSGSAPEIYNVLKAYGLAIRCIKDPSK